MRSTCIAILTLFAFAVPAAAHRFEAKVAPVVAPHQLVSSEMAWTCEGGVCSADGALIDAPARLCGRLAHDIGKLETFSVDGAPIPSDAITKCNARAK